MRKLWIIGEFHPYYELYNHRLPKEFRKILKRIVEMEETLIRSIKPDTVFVEYPEDWGLEEELKYRAEFFRLSEEECGRKLSEKEVETIMRRGYGERMRFYNRIRKNSRLIFLEDKDEYIKAGETLIEALKAGEKDPYSKGEFQLSARERERRFYERVKDEDFRRGVVICGLAHVIKESDSGGLKEAEWIERLEKILEVRVFLIDLEEAGEGIIRELSLEQSKARDSQSSSF